MIEILFKHHTIIRDSRDGLLIDGVRYTKTSFYRDAIDHLNLSDADRYKASKDTMLYSQLHSTAKTEKQAEKSEEVEEFNRLYTVYTIQDEHSHKDGLIVYDKVKDSFNTIVYNHLYRLYGKPFMDALPKIPATHLYNPLMNINTSKIRPLEDGSYEINTYEVPTWRERYHSEHVEGATYELPPIMDRFLRHLFPLEEARHYILKWLYYALTSKRGNIETLVLQGLPGTGKSVFAEVVLRALFGGSRSGYLKSPKSALGKFQAALIRRRLVVMDEFKITYKTYDDFKMLSNDKLTFEKKGIDADKEYDKHFSLVATLNESRDWYLTQDDRRSSIVELTDKKLEAAWSLSEIEEFINLNRDDEDFIYQVGAYILSLSWCSGEVTPLYQYRSAKFYKFVYESLSQWKKDFIEYTFTQASRGNTEVDITDYCKKSSKGGKMVGRETLITFIETYLHEGSNLLGQVVIDDEEDNQIIASRVLEINPIFLGEEVE